MSLPRRPLGQTGMEVSVLGLGTVKFGRNQEVKYPTTFSLPSDQEIVDLLELSKELGINLIDTAPAYGSSEQRLGRLLENRPDWIICTKVGEEFLNGKSFFDFTADHTKTSIERSLRNIDTDYLDIVLIHSDGRDVNILESSECLGALLELKDEGVIKAIGMSTKSVDGGLKAAELTDVVMATYNPSALDDEEVIRYAASLNKGVLIKKALNSGHDCSTDDNFKFALSPEGVSSIVVGTINADHLRDNVNSILKAVS